MQSKKDLYQIGEVARLFHLSISLLRHYDKTGLVTPEYTDPDTGYRYYSIRQFECLNTIRYLRALDMPLEEIGDFLHNRDTGRIQELLSKQLVQVHKKQQELTVIEHQIKNRLNQIQGALSAHPGEIFLEKKSPLQLACMKKQLNPENYLDLEYSIREMEQGNSPASIFLGKVGVGLFYDSLKAHRFKPYDFVFIILEEDDKNKIIRLKTMCLMILFLSFWKRMILSMVRSSASRKAPGLLSVFTEVMSRRRDFMKNFCPILRTRDLRQKALLWK